MIALTGATGFLGRHIAAALTAENKPVRCLARENSPHFDLLSPITKRIQFVDYRRVDSIRNAVRGCETLIHTLGIINADTQTLHEVNEGITGRLMEAAKAEGCQKIIHISSVAAGMRHGPYGESKFHGEGIVRTSGIPHTILRPAYIYGQGDENNTALLIRTLKRWPVVPLLGGGTFKLQPVYVDDAVQVVLRALELSAQNNFFNVAGAEQISLKSMLIELSRNLKVKRPFLPIPLRPVQACMRLLLAVVPNTRLPAKQILELDKHEAFDISLTREVFGFRPRSYEAGARAMFAGVSCAA